MHHGNALAVTPPTAATVRHTDGRLLYPTFVNPQVFPTHGTDPGGLGGNYEETYRLNATQRYTIDLSHVILASDNASSNAFFELAFSIVNTSMTVTMRWTEYRLT